MKHLLIFLFALFLLPRAFAWDSNIAIPAAAPVVDEFGLLESGEKRDLTNSLLKIKEKSGVEVSVFIPKTLQGYEIEDFSIDVARKWGLGQKKTDRGLLLVIAPKERRMRFEVGSGLEGDLTDAFTGRVLDNVIRPYFKRGDYYAGIIYGIDAIQEKIPLGLEADSLPPRKSKGIHIPPPLIFVLVVILIVMIQVLQNLGILPRNRYRGGGGSWHSGGSGGFGSGGFGGSSRGSWGGGGGGFSGGGSSSSW